MPGEPRFLVGKAKIKINVLPPGSAFEYHDVLPFIDRVTGMNGVLVCGESDLKGYLIEFPGAPFEDLNRPGVGVAMNNLRMP